MTQPIFRFIQNKRLGRGVNILGYDPIWKNSSEARMNSKHFELISKAGFNHVRINLNPFEFVGEAPDYQIKQAWLDILDWVLEECKKNNLLAILDVHEFIAMAEDPFLLKPKFLAVWEQLSLRYKDLDNTVIFEILNEPNNKITPELWNQYFLEPLAIIRKTNSTRTVIIGPAYWNGIDYLHELKLPEGEQNVIVTVHYYHPMDFTHQGAYWSKEHCNKSGIKWLGSEADLKRLELDFAGVQAWSKDQSIPIYLGEFGAYEKADMDSRARYTQAVSKKAEQLGWSWAYWQFDSDFILYDIIRDEWVEPIREALI